MPQKPLKHISATAPDGTDGEEGEWSFPVNWLSYIVNDHATASLYVAFDGQDPYGDHAIEIQAEDGIEDIPLYMPDGVNLLRVRSESGSEVPFRALGVYRSEYRDLNEARDAAIAAFQETERARAEVRRRMDTLENRAENILENIRELLGRR